MAIGKNKRLTKCVAASEADSEDCDNELLSAKASGAAARGAHRQPPRRRQQQQQLWESLHAGRGMCGPPGACRSTERTWPSARRGPPAAGATPAAAARGRRRPERTDDK